jgi:hypothetical protein
MIKYLPGATVIGQGTMIKLLRSAAGFGLGSRAKFLRRYNERRRGQRLWQQGQVPATYTEWRREHRPGHHA